MDAQKFAVPLLAFAGGAILGRVFGLKTLVRGAMTAAAVTGIASPPTAMIGSNTHQRAAGTRRKPARRKSAKRSASRARSA